jgi:hypothetical protein
MSLSRIHYFSSLQTGFPIRIASGMTNCEGINFGFFQLALTLIRAKAAQFSFVGKIRACLATSDWIVINCQLT